MSAPSARFYEFGPFRLDTAAPLLWREGQPVSLTPKALETLVVLVQRAGRLTSREELIEAVWPDTVVEENNLSVNISMLRKALGDSEEGEKYIETVPRRGYRFVAQVKVGQGNSGAWVLDKRLRASLITNEERDEGAQSRALDLLGAATVGPSGEPEAREPTLSPALEDVTTEAGRSKSPGFRQPARLARPRPSIVLGAAALILTASVIAYFYFARDVKVIADRGAITSVAVMPFGNPSANPDTEYLSDGITESLINQLSRLPKLKVMSRNSVFHYKGRETDARLVGNELGVEAVLLGRVVQRGDGRSISVELVDAGDNSHLWGEQYERRLSDVLAVQREITREITENLRLSLTGSEQDMVNKRYTEDADAYQLYLKGRYFWNKRTGDAFTKGIEYFNQAIVLDPNYALAYSGLADSYSLLGDYDVMKPTEAYPKAKVAATKALAIDEGLAEAHASLATILAAYDWNWAGADSEYKRAIELKPNYAPAHQWYAEYLAGMGRHTEAIAEIKRAQELDPFSLITNAVGAWVFYFARQYDEAIAQCQKVIAMDANFGEVYAYLGRAYEQKGMYAEALDAFQKRRTLLGFRAVGDSGDRDSQESLSPKEYWRQRLRRLEGEERAKFGQVSAHGRAECFAQLGDKDQAFNWLERAYEERSFWLMYLKVAPNLDSLRTDPRFSDLLLRVKLAP